MEQSAFYFDLQEIVSAFVVLFAVIDVTGLLPVFIDFQNKGMKISPAKAAIYSLIAFVAFLFAGNAILQLFQVDISSFAVAGSLVIFVMAGLVPAIHVVVSALAWMPGAGPGMTQRVAGEIPDAR